MADPYADEPRIAAWDRRLDWPLTGLAVVFLALYAWSVLDPTLGAGPVVDAALTVIWIVFGLEYLVRLALARRKWRFVGTHVIDLVILLLPMFRQLRVLRIVTVISVLNRQLRDDFRGRIAVYVTGTVGLVGFTAALAVLEAERNAPGATITSFGEAVWWTITTISTVGYGDRYPVTVEGRIIAATLMVAGIALLGVVTASIAGWFVANLRESTERTETELNEADQKLDLLLAEVRMLRARLDALEAPSDRPSPADRSGPAPR
ncbi:potassium channel family protein [Pseudonocardia ailaonensis]|uniref:Potassium channel family protein n=1 Tax=Pseudonocardia ailaonensis TaxID=367279 RepID=A0ABN2NI74_9PSEU